jgi:uncharacterized RDD family membrane protein YckC
MRGGDEDGPLRELVLRGERAARTAQARELDMDRMIGVVTPPPEELPLFQDEGEAKEAAPDLEPLTPPGPARAPLSVRRSTPVTPRPRARAIRPEEEPAARNLELPLPEEPDVVQERVADSVSSYTRSVSTAVAAPVAGIASRLLAAAVDAAILIVLNAIVIYFTLRMSGLASHEWAVLPLVPLGAFLLFLDAGYLATFTAAGGQTVGKMACGLKVVGHADLPVSTALAIVRAFGALGSFVVLGLGFVPALLGSERRALHDRLADTRVVQVIEA